MKQEKKLRKSLEQIKNNKMIKQFNLLLKIICICYIYFSFDSLRQIENHEYIINIKMTINDKYYLWRQDETENGKISLNMSGEVKLHECKWISKIAFSSRYDYIIGYLTGEEIISSDNNELENKKCKGYFYINTHEENNAKFSLSEKDIKEKFGNITYENPSKFLNIFGEGSDDSYNISMIFFENQILSIFYSIVIYIVLNSLIFMNKFLKSKFENIC